mmetsp:Transcript_129358/g.258259  ORF Transcript_129358/g.258259 Transcript_129358/m.258259 type:complete len:137 (-) Transcript_129358:40-450(-)
MRNVGPGKWREWRLGNEPKNSLVVPLFITEPKVAPDAPPPPKGKEKDAFVEKSLTEAAYLTVRAMMAKNAMPKLTDAIQEMVKEPDDDTGCIHERRFRDVLQETAAQVLSPAELEAIFPTPPPPETPGSPTDAQNA